MSFDVLVAFAVGNNFPDVHAARGLRLNAQVVLTAQLGWVTHPPIISIANIITRESTKRNANPLGQSMRPIRTHSKRCNFNA